MNQDEDRFVEHDGLEDGKVPNDHEARRYLDKLESKRLRKLYLRSCNLNGLNGLFVFGILFSGLTLLIAVGGVMSDTEMVILACLVGFGLATIFTLLVRATAGRILGIISCIPMLFSFPLGTLIGAMGLFALIKEPILFGPKRITHAQVKAAYKYRKKHKQTRRDISDQFGIIWMLALINIL